MNLVAALLRAVQWVPRPARGGLRPGRAESVKSMKRAWLTLLVPLLPGCVAVQAFFHYPSLFTEYKKGGFIVRDDWREFRYDGLKNKSVLEIRESLVLEDLESDGVVDRVRAGPTEYGRGEMGTKALFVKYDRIWRDTTAYMSIGHFQKKWRAMKPTQITTRWTEARHKP